ncbi:uncharacterized protein LOC132263959 [Phlebotomus argentipes]|uniref:uncharacterized protein LOC132263959 n=1 Tax=Phlebotomus argentipes TaxID=94469 RepID=UPI002893376E|nr:uncharacterized protein LOC132263959 [Phlebotomus argentipes]
MSSRLWYRDLSIREDRENPEESDDSSDASESVVMRSSSPRLTVEEIEALIPAFEPGKEGSLLASEWLRKVDNVAALYGLKPQRMLLTAIIRLQGSAKVWYEGNEVNIRDYKHFKVELTKNFPQKLTAADVHKVLTGRKRRSDESVETYFHDVVKQARRIKLDDASIRDYLINGVSDVLTRGLLAAAPQGPLTDFLVYMKKVETNTKMKETEVQPQSTDDDCSDASSDSSSKKQCGADDGAQETSEVQGECSRHSSVNSATSLQGKTKKDKESKNSGQSKRVCFACGSKEHLIRSCPKMKGLRVAGGDDLGGNSSQQK